MTTTDNAQSAPRRTSYAVQAKGISKQFALVDAEDAWRLAFGGVRGVSTHQALTDVSISARKGQFTGVLGLNGAGKTTLLRTLGGVYSPDSGVVAIGGAMSAIYELGVAGNAFLTGQQYARRLLAMVGIRGKAQEPLIADIEQFCELGDRFNDRVQGYSTGMAARLYFAVATAGFYDVYLIDEVLTVGDQYFQAKCWRRLRDRLRKGASGILCTHDWSAILRICSHALILDKGRVVFEGPPERVTRKYLYGDEMSHTNTEGIARIIRAPAETVTVKPGTALRFPLTIEIQRKADVCAVAALERLNIGTGWETMLMSRAPDFIGGVAGLYEVEFCIPEMPLAPGDYVLSAGLVMPDGKGGRISLDSFGWLSGNGLTVRVEATDKADLLALPVKWDAYDA